MPKPVDSPGGPPRRTEDPTHMREALALAARGWGRVSPNPMVGAVVAQGPEVVGRGWHAEFGGEHAEVVALREAGERAAGATLYVTLEPCAHRGKTGPCTEAIRKAGIRRVVIACRDPNPESGSGAEELRRARLDVEIGGEATDAKRMNAPFLWYHTTGVPFTSLKLAVSLDAKLGARGVRTAVSSPAAWEHVHHLRAGHDAILIGGRTAEIDDPLLTPRGEAEPRQPPVRVVLDPAIRLSPKSQLARTIEVAPVWVFGDPREEEDRERSRILEQAGVTVLEAPRESADRLELDQVWATLGTRGVTSILAEGGGQLSAALLRVGRVQRLHLFLAPIFFGSNGVEAFPDIEPSARGDWTLVERRGVGPDTLLVLEHRSLELELDRL